MSDVDIESMKIILRILRTGGYYVSPDLTSGGASAHDWLVTWTDALDRFEFAALEESAKEWVTVSDEFPTIARFTEVAQRVTRRRAAIRAGLAHPKGLEVVCPECGADKGWVFYHDDSGHEMTRPCSICAPEQYERWRGGHWQGDAGHSQEAHDRYTCDDETCRRLTRRK